MALATLLIPAELMRDALGLPADCDLAKNETGHVALTINHVTIPPGTDTVTAGFCRTPSEIKFIGFYKYTETKKLTPPELDPMCRIISLTIGQSTARAGADPKYQAVVSYTELPSPGVYHATIVDTPDLLYLFASGAPAAVYNGKAIPRSSFLIRRHPDSVRVFDPRVPSGGSGGGRG